MKKGYFSFVLHAHLPFVRHPEHEDFLEEDWLFEAITETYIPIIDLIDRLGNEGLKFRFTFTMSGTLMNMLNDEMLKNRYLKYLDKLIDFITREETRLKSDVKYEKIIVYYKNYYEKIKDLFLYKYKTNLLEVLRKFQNDGYLELIPVTATHCFLPVIKEYPEALNAQIKIAKEEYKKFFEKEPNGIWLAECGYFPGIESILERHNIKYIYCDSNALAMNPPKYSNYKPVYSGKNIVAFPRNAEATEEIWNEHYGFPGHSLYRETYRDVGFDLDYEYIKEFLHNDGIRRNIGIKYYSITDKKENNKNVYDFDLAKEQINQHAKSYVYNRIKQIEYANFLMDGFNPLVNAIFDAELFGHWWHEGPYFIEAMIREINNQNIIKMITANDYLKYEDIEETAQLTESSWGGFGYHDTWLSKENCKIYRHIHKSIERMVELVNLFKNNENLLVERALNQASREILLSQTSCWPFIIKKQTSVGYATKKLNDHLINFNKIYFGLIEKNIEEKWLEKIENQNNIFKDIDFRSFC